MGWGRRVSLTPLPSLAIIGFLVKDTPARELADAVRRVHAGLRMVDPHPATESLMSGPSPLTTRESEILLLAMDGSPVAVIAARAQLSVGTIRNYLSAAIGKAGGTEGLVGDLLVERAAPERGQSCGEEVRGA